MEILHTVLSWLEGKKTTIFGIAALIVSFFVTKGGIDADTGTLIQSILTILAGGASWATNQAYKTGALKK